jgi:hypothetical protein
VADPGEGVAADGTIRTGARRDQVPAAFEPVLADAVAFLEDSQASLYVYGSVANGTVRLGSSDVDLLSIGLPHAAILGQRLSARYADRCRGMEVAAATASDFAGQPWPSCGGNGPHYVLGGLEIPGRGLSAFPDHNRECGTFGPLLVGRQVVSEPHPDEV